jgi:hypothetical protein
VRHQSDRHADTQTDGGNIADAAPTPTDSHAGATTANACPTYTAPANTNSNSSPSHDETASECAPGTWGSIRHCGENARERKR